jgi:hypothetical protein
MNLVEVNYKIIKITGCYKDIKMVKQSRYRPGVAQRVPGT